jgi:clan AA aspartic protease (TIGR02281 family)
MKVLAEGGNAYAQYELSLNYSAGIGVSPDDAESVRWLKRSADQNYPPALNELGARYEQGRGVAKNRTEAVRLFRLAAARGEVNARLNLERLGERVPAATAAPPPAAPDKAAIAAILRAHDATSNNANIGANSNSAANVLVVPLQRVGGVLTVPVKLNGAIAANFVLDSGASDVSIPEPLANALRKAGKLADSDILGSEPHMLANGSIVAAKTFTLRSIQVGSVTVMNVRASIAQGNAVPLLGQSFLRQFASWSIDNNRQALVLSGWAR